MSNLDLEIVVDDPTAPEVDSPAITSTGSVEIFISLLLLALAVTLGYDNWRTGIAWDSTGPQAGYFPFYLSVILGGASFYGLAITFQTRREARKPSSPARRCAGSCRCSFRRCCSVSLRSFSGSTSQVSC
jgi:hypothetical protein